MKEKVVEAILTVDKDAPSTVKSQVSATKWVLALNGISLLLLIGLNQVLKDTPNTK